MSCSSRRCDGRKKSIASRGTCPSATSPWSTRRWRNSASRLMRRRRPNACRASGADGDVVAMLVRLVWWTTSARL
eukprot:6625667-Heterocapsa_arctica.AAC.1